MDKDQIDDMIKFAEEESKPEERDFDKRHSGKPRFFNFQKLTLYIGGAVVLVLIIIVTFFSSGGGDLSTADFNALMKRVDRIEARLTDMEGLEERMTAVLQAQKNTLSEDATATAVTGGTMTQQIDLLARKVELLQQKMGSTVEKAQADRTGTALSGQSKKAQYHVVARGETLYRIALKYGLTVDKLRDLNKITPPQSIHPGQKLLVSTAKDS